MSLSGQQSQYPRMSAQRKTFSIALAAIVFCLLGNQSSEGALEQSGSPEASRNAEWTALVSDSSTADLKFDGDIDKPQAPWKTFIIEGNKARTVSGPVICSDKHLFRLVLKQHVNRSSYRKHEIHSRVDELILLNLKTGKAVSLISPSAGLKQARAAQSEAKLEIPNADTFQSSIYVKGIQLLSICGNKLSIHEFEYTQSPTANHGNGVGKWKVFELKNDKLVSSSIPISRQMEIQAAKLLEKKEFGRELVYPAEDGTPTLQSGHFAGIAIAPGKGSCSLHYAISAQFGAQYDVDEYVTLPLSDRPPSPACKKLFSSLPTKDPRMQFYSFSPDGECVVYALNRELFWRTANDKQAQSLGKVRAIRGIQWVRGSFR